MRVIGVPIGGAHNERAVETLQNIARLETSWKELEARATHSFYLSWPGSELGYGISRRARNHGKRLQSEVSICAS